MYPTTTRIRTEALGLKYEPLTTILPFRLDTLILGLLG